jgi:hypothetical protein
MIKSAALVLLLVLLASGCSVYDTLTEGFQHTEEVSNDLEKEIKSKPLVGFNWSNGVLNSVTITFDDIPQGKSISDIANAARDSVASRFKQEPSTIIISFSLPGSNN